MVVQRRCEWCEGDDLYLQYHDTEWGVPVFHAQDLFERLVLESMQAGLSWLTVLKKRAHMSQQFYRFDMTRLADSTQEDVEHWLQDPGLIRHRGKLQAMVNNARLTLEQADFTQWLWGFAPERLDRHENIKTVPATTAESHAMSRALKKAGYQFVGPTICYAFMQSVGMVNDHVSGCWRYPACADMARTRPAGTN